MNDIIPDLGFFQSSAGWATQVFIIVFAALLFDFTQKRILKRVQRRLEKTSTPWDDALIESVRKPLSILIWVIGITFAAQIVKQKTDAAIFEAIIPLRDLAIITLIAWFLIRFIKQVENNIITAHEAAGKKIDRTTADAIAKLFRISVIITAVLVALQTLGFSISGVLAFGGIGGIAVGFAAKDLLANFFGGLMIYLDRPFVIGDWIRSPDRDIEGTVENIGWRLTCIRTFDKRPLYIPNSVYATISVENPSRMTHRRIYETIGIRYDDAAKMEGIVTDVKEMLLNHPDIDQDQTLMVNFNKFGPSSLDFFVYTFTRTTVWTEYHQVKEKILLLIVDIISRHNAEIAFPTSTIHVPDGIQIETQHPVASEVSQTPSR